MKKQIGILLAAFLILLLGWFLLPAPAREQEAPPEEDIAGLPPVDHPTALPEPGG